MTEAPPPAFYARVGGRRADWWTLLHPPYTLWHLSYPVLGACLAPRVDGWVLGATALAFFLAVGVAAHALDELNDRPLRTAIPDRTLTAAAGLGLAAALGLGIAVLPHSGLVLIPFMVLGVVLVLGYNLELFGGRLHTDLSFAAAWGGFPVAVGFVAQAPPLTAATSGSAAAAVLAATALSYAQRCLSTPARTLRRRTARIEGALTFDDGSRQVLDRDTLLAPLERTLRALSRAVPLLALAALLARAPR
ncbi:hypothetical protein [Streptacidiphilus sp. EB129]|uniref:hypothetical protein n=1 Tax=Streptacidiphilus sp. EB129 TaxID=3156262 RepID=UPI003514DCAD